MKIEERSANPEGVAVVEIPIANLVRGRAQTFELPDYRNIGLVISEIQVTSYQLGTNESGDGLHPLELKLLSSGNPVGTYSRTLLQRNDGKVVFRDSGTLETSSNLSLQIKSVFPCKNVVVSIIYQAHSGIPVYQTELALSGLEESQTDFWKTLVKELHKTLVTKIEFFPNVGTTKCPKSLIIKDPYLNKSPNMPTGMTANYRIELLKNEVGVFELKGTTLPPIEDLLRAKLNCFEETGELITPNEIGVIIYGFPKVTNN